jgi:hypothetical protein
MRARVHETGAWSLARESTPEVVLPLRVIGEPSRIPCVHGLASSSQPLLVNRCAPVSHVAPVNAPDNDIAAVLGAC